MMKLHGLKMEDKQFIVGSVVAPIVIWWIFVGRKRYGTKGMKNV